MRTEKGCNGQRCDENAAMPMQQVDLSDEQASFIRSSIEHGRFEDADQVVRAGLKLLEAQESMKLEEMRRLVDEGIRSIEEGRFTIVTSETVGAFLDSLRPDRAGIRAS